MAGLLYWDVMFLCICDFRSSKILLFRHYNVFYDSNVLIYCLLYYFSLFCIIQHNDPDWEVWIVSSRLLFILVNDCLLLDA